LFLLLRLSVFGLSLAAGMLKMDGTPPEVNAGERMVITEAAVLVFLIAFLKGEKLSWSEAFGLSNRPRHAVLSGFVVACVFLAFVRRDANQRGIFDDFFASQAARATSCARVASDDGVVR